MNLSQIADAPTTPMDTDERSFWAEVEQFKRKADDAYTLWQKLRTKRQAAASNAALQAEYNDVMGEAENIATKMSDVERVTNAAKAGIYETVTGWFGLEGVNNLKRNLGQLGFVYVAAIALVAAAAAWLGTWIVKGNIMDRKLTAVENLIAGGVSPGEAGALIEEKGDPGPFAAMFGNIGTGIAVAGIAAMVLYFFMEKKRGF
jgi:hypothetical protein